MNSNIVLTRPNRRQPRRSWDERTYVPVAPVRQPLDAPDSRPEPKVSESILRQLQAEPTRVVSLNSLPYGWEQMPEYADHIYVGRVSGKFRDGYFGNPFTVGKDFPDYGVKRCSQAQALHLYRSEFLPRMLQDEAFAARVAALSGKTLVASDVCAALTLAYTVDMLALLQ